ncbi:4Fe-4S dicluster domain-containing protein [Campylobacter corcagiensis]|uniref:4Fe-4S dicluster domain-containing protein n=1 Tax=Campylobacter corcagiensis TaxID=1448857 RepID=A0A7M1LI57_9BACT|nr:4Fe-4S dicluster domain-containing protein [Campylobacter corcagiensis]QKF65370.1 [4Fe-4S] dicluster domain-containing protein [Campylobacter corcagiensis]QOQ88053.1 4Fe-4S dicluster domain-containing protein [Campylobacter corcagiensis]
MREFVFLDDFDSKIITPDEIEFITKPNDEQYLVSNSNRVRSEIFAPEINFYAKMSQDDTLTKSKNLSLLYEVRARVFDTARDIDYQKEIGNNVLIISDSDESDTIEFIKQYNFKVVALSHAEVKFLYGEMGDLFVTILRENDEFEVEADFVLVREAKEYMLRQSGVVEISRMTDDEILDYLQKRSPLYKYKSAITYDSTICQYHGRRSEHCAKCVEICPTVAILKDDEKKELVFNHIDCHECGGCVAVCPSGAMDYAKFPRDAFYDVAKMYKDKKIVITPRIMDIDRCDAILPKGFLPFAIEGEKFLSETHYLTLLQESGASLIYYSDVLSPGTMEAIELVNGIIKAKFDKVGIYVATDEIELRQALKNSDFIDGLYYTAQENTLAKREIFAKRVKHIVGDDDLGVVKSGEWVRYGQVYINQDSCTLCLSCVGACNVGALVADEITNSIKFNPSICTTCGYCEMSCAEKDTIKLERSGYELRPSYFEFKELARDSLFACIECGKEFATSKSVMKIAQMLAPLWSNDPIKAKTLYCCGDCKAKIMIKEQIKDDLALRKSIEDEVKNAR